MKPLKLIKSVQLIKPESRIYIAGHTGLVGSALKQMLEKRGYHNLIFHTHQELDLKDQLAVEQFFADQQPEYVFLAAAKVGGIWANAAFSAEFIYDNLMIQTNIIHAAYRFGVRKLLFLGSSCIYPKLARQPIKETYLLTGKLEPTNEPYAIAKIAGIKLCQAYQRQYQLNCLTVMPTNLYGPGDNFEGENSHVIPALLGRFHQAMIKQEPLVSVWGTGKPRREFLFSEDLADACIFLMNYYNSADLINVGSGSEVSIKELVKVIAKITGFTGKVLWNTKMPDGTPRKRLDLQKITRLGWKPQYSLVTGIEKTYEWYLREFHNPGTRL